MFATDDETERTLWVQAVYRATGQSHKPVPPVSQPAKVNNTLLSKVQGGTYSSTLTFFTRSYVVKFLCVVLIKI